ncbi:MAG: prolyl oligopeptidase family protein [Phycisphaerales bacterium]|nr:prolyl oligopeptidase family protein [Phycisphaerales bacterium]
MPSASVILPWLYLVAPVLAGVLAIARARRSGSPGPVREFLVTCVTGAILGAGVGVWYSFLLHQRVGIWQILVACYWAIVVMVLLKGSNRLLAWGIGRAMPKGQDGRPCCPAADVFGKVLRAGVLLALGIPFVAGMALTYRPRVVHPGTPATLLNAAYAEVSFSATDGVPLRGWWIPASRSERTDDRHPGPPWGEQTVIICHGFGADKAADLLLARDLVPNGYNVLAFDFRAHGESGGQFTTFGDLERRDVLGAVRWVRGNHAAQSHKLFGLGESMGAAALISAAADASPEGQAIDAVAVFAPFDRLTDLFQGMADDRFAPSAGWLARRIALPAAGLQLGADLVHFAPGHDVQSLWPRPLLVISAEANASPTWGRTQELYDDALQPKYLLEVDKGEREAVLFGSKRTSTAVRVFFGGARQIL